MNMELFDIVDKHDKVVGTTGKKTAHTVSQMHRIAVVFALQWQNMSDKLITCKIIVAFTKVIILKHFDRNVFCLVL